MNRIFILGVTIASLLLTHGACSDSDGTDGDGGSGGGTGGGGPTFGDSACATCIGTACGLFISACEGEPACIAYIDCVAACPVGADGNAEVACAGGCPEPDSSAAALLKEDYEVCRTSTADCTECGHVVDEPHPFEGQKCSPSSTGNVCFDCVQTKCCDTFYACSASADCLYFEDCIELCSGPTQGQCMIDCQHMHPEGAQLTNVDNACWDSLCGPECNPFWNDCKACIRESCDLENIACDMSLECSEAKLCVSDCLNNPSCNDHSACFATLSPEAYDLWTLERVCVAQNCGHICE